MLFYGYLMLIVNKDKLTAMKSRYIYFVVKYSRIFFLSSLLLCAAIHPVFAQFGPIWKGEAWSNPNRIILSSALILNVGIITLYAFPRTGLWTNTGLLLKDSAISRGDVAEAIVREGFWEVSAARRKESLFLDSLGNYLLVKHKRKGKHRIRFISKRRALRGVIEGTPLTWQVNRNRGYFSNSRGDILEKIKRNLEARQKK